MAIYYGAETAALGLTGGARRRFSIGANRLVGMGSHVEPLARVVGGLVAVALGCATLGRE